MQRFFIHQAMQLDLSRLMALVDPAQQVTELSFDGKPWFSGDLKARVTTRDTSHATAGIEFTFPDGETVDRILSGRHVAG